MLWFLLGVVLVLWLLIKLGAALMRSLDGATPPATTQRDHQGLGRTRPQASTLDTDEAPGASSLHRSDFIAKEEEELYIRRDASGRLNLRLVDMGDRLAIRSAERGGGFINPRGPGLRHVGLFVTQARGWAHHLNAYRAADLRKGRPVELIREPSNPHDSNAVGMRAPGARDLFAYVQRGRAPAIAKRLDAGEDLVALTLNGPGPGQDAELAYVLIGARDDVDRLLGEGQTH